MIHYFSELAKLNPLLSPLVKPPIKIVFGKDVELQVPLYEKSNEELFLKNNVKIAKNQIVNYKTRHINNKLVIK